MFFGTGAGQRSLYPLGFYNIPIYNVSNACATGSNALLLARQFVQSGLNECCLALGVEKMQPGSLGGEMGGGATMLDFHLAVMSEKYDLTMTTPLMPQMFGNAGREHMEKYGTTAKQFAMIGEKNHRHSANNPYAQFRDQYTLEQVEKSGDIYAPLTKLQCSPTSDGAGCAIVCSEEFVVKHGLQGQAIEIVGQAMTTDSAESFNDEELHARSCIDVIGFPMAKNCADQVLSSLPPPPRLPHRSSPMNSAQPPLPPSLYLPCGTGLQTGRDRTGGGPGRGAPRLLLLQRAYHLRGPRSLPGRGRR